MDRVTAAKMMGIFETVSHDLDRAAQLAAKAIENEIERRRVIRAVGSILSDLFTELMHPIVAEHPDLDPLKDWKAE